MQLNKHIPKETKSLLQTISHLATENNIEIYVVGGFVRDLLHDKKVKDLDFVVLGDALDAQLGRHDKWTVYPQRRLAQTP